MTDELSDAEIVKALRSDDPADRQIALDAVYGGANVALVEGTDLGTVRMATTTATRAPALAVGLVYATQQVAKGLGITLAWLQTQPQPSNGLPPGLILPDRRV